MPVIAVGAYNAPLFQNALKICGVQNLILPEWNIYSLPQGDDTLTDQRKKVLRLAEEKVLRYVDMEAPRNSIIFGFHSTATFHDEELLTAHTSEELEENFKRIVGKTFVYRVGIAVGKTGTEGVIRKMNMERVRLEPRILRLTPEEIHAFVKKIPEETISASGPDYRPFTNEYFAEMVEEVSIETKIFTNLVVSIINAALI